MRLGNAPPIEGRQAARDAWAAFCEGIEGVAHTPVAQWHSDHGTVAEAEVTYTRKDGGTVTVPVATIYREKDGLIKNNSTGSSSTSPRCSRLGSRPMPRS